MKRLLLFLPAALLAFSAEAQVTSGERELLLAVRNYGGNVMQNPGIRAMIKGRNEPPRLLDPWGELDLRVSPGDTLVLLTKRGKSYQFLTDGHEELIYVRFRSRNKLAPRRRVNDYSDKLVVGFGVDPVIDNPTTPAHVKDGKSEGYEYLKDFMRDNVTDVRFRGNRLVVVGANSASNDYYEALVVVDGKLMPNFDTANKIVDPADVISIDVMRNGGESTYGNRALNGVVVITTVKSLQASQSGPQQNPEPPRRSNP